MAKDESISFKCDQEFGDWLRKEAFGMGKPISEIIRACLILGLPQIKAVRGLDRVSLEDVRKQEV